MKASSRGIVVVFCLAVMGLVGTVFAERPDKFVRYVEATGDQFVDTEIIALPNTKFECKMEWIEFKDSAFLACRQDSGDTRFYACYCLNTSGEMYPALRKGSRISYNGKDIRFEKSRVYNYISEFSSEYSDGSVTNTVTVDGTKIYSAGAEALYPNLSVYIFANNLGTSAVYGSKTRCYGLKIWQDGVLKRDFKPCVKNNRAGLYDVCSEKIYYSGSGTDLVYDENIDDTVLDYVEANGKTYLNTGIKGRSGTSAEMEVMFMDSGDLGFLESRNGDNRFYLLHCYTSGNWLYGYGKYYQFGDNAFHTCKKYYVKTSLAKGSQVIEVGENGPEGATKVVVNNTDGSEIDTDLPMYLFGCNLDGKAAYLSKARIYWLKIYQDGELVRDYRPRLENGIAALYDAVSEKVFYPEGDELTYAPRDNTEAVENLNTLAFVEYIESDGQSYLDTRVAATPPLRATGTFSYVHSRTHNEEQTYLSGLWNRTYLGCNNGNLGQMLMINESNQYFSFGFGDKSVHLFNSSDYSQFRALAGTKWSFDVSLADGEQVFKMSDAEKTETSTQNWSGNGVDVGGNLYLFACNNTANLSAANRSAARCYGLKLYKGEELLRDFKPCVKDGWVALYDTVSKRVFYPTPRVSAAGRTGAVLAESYDNAEVASFLEYVETDGTQYVDTGVVGKSGQMFTFKEMKISANNSNESCFLGSRDRTNSANVRFFPWYYANGNEIAIGYDADYLRIGTGGENYKYYQGMTSYAQVKMMPNRQVSLKDETTGQWTIMLQNSTSSVINTGKNLYLFAENDNGTPQRYCMSRFYWLKINEGGKPFRYLYPARLKNGLVALWDIKGNKAYPPMGSDGQIRPFSAAGPEIPYSDVMKFGLKLIVR